MTAASLIETKLNLSLGFITCAFVGVVCRELDQIYIKFGLFELIWPANRLDFCG